MTNRTVTRNAYTIFLADMNALLAPTKPKKIRERVLSLVGSLLTILEALAPRSLAKRREMVEDIKEILDRSPCEEFQKLLRAFLHRLQKRAT
jgi:hypothetical protein